MHQHRNPYQSPPRSTAASLTTALLILVLGALGGLGGLAGCADQDRPGPARGAPGTPGAAGAGDPYFPRLGNGGYDVTHYGLTLDYDPAVGRLDATAAITARATHPLSAFNLDLAGLTVGRVTVDGARAGVRRADTELTVRPRADIGRGATFRTVVRYSGVPRALTDADRTREGWLRAGKRSVALGQPRGSMAWFPGNHHPSDKAAYDIRITVPKGQQAISNGELTSERTAGGRTAFSWHCAEPMASYLATVAVGPYRTKTSQDATDATDATDPRDSASPTHPTSPTRSTGSTRSIPVHTAVDPTVAAGSAGLLARIPAIMKWGEQTFGPYPFSSTGVIIGRPGDADYNLETQNRPFLPGPSGIGILVHELAHQWFGNSVTPKSWRDIWLSEGFAEYAEWLWAESEDGVPASRAFDRAYADDENWAFPPAEPPTAADISARPVYGRGAMVLHQLRLAVGDEEFFALVRGWTRAHRHGNASTADFTTFAQRRTDRDLTALWAAWLYGSEKPPPDE
ncbi:M1 family metallopeptidase [Streptomyces sp. NPDC057307]|uniref:M1 family metallopeptidase n=1 Tax=Streptomyces sp. NPDC057307 TaxID=3346096 RepID=UPI003638718F